MLVDGPKGRPVGHWSTFICWGTCSICRFRESSRVQGSTNESGQNVRQQRQRARTERHHDEGSDNHYWKEVQTNSQTTRTVRPCRHDEAPFEVGGRPPKIIRQFRSDVISFSRVPVSHKQCFQLIAIVTGIVLSHSQQLRHETHALTALQVQEQMNRVRDLMPNRRVR